MANLSERVYNPNTDKTSTHIIKGESTMVKVTGKLRTLNLTLIDNNPNLKVENKVVFQQLGYMTEHNDDRTIQQILMSGKVAEALVKHNELRVKVVDKEIQRNTGRDVTLEEVEIFDLDWQVIQVA